MQFTIQINDKNKTVTGTFTSQQDNNEFLATSKPASLLSNKIFILKAKIEGPASQNGQNGKSSLKVDDILVTVENAPLGLSTSNTNRSRGQFYKIYLSKL